MYDQSPDIGYRNDIRDCWIGHRWGRVVIKGTDYWSNVREFWHDHSCTRVLMPDRRDVTVQWWSRVLKWPIQHSLNTTPVPYVRTMITPAVYTITGQYRLSTLWHIITYMIIPALSNTTPVTSISIISLVHHFSSLYHHWTVRSGTVYQCSI